MLQQHGQTLKARLGIVPSLCACESRFKRHCCASLLPIQTWALKEIEEVGGLLGPIGVGHGKTLLDLLTPMVVSGCKSAVLLLPPNLKAQLLEVDWKFYGQHWQLPNLAGGKYFFPGRPLLHVVAYTELSSPRNSDLLSRLRPDVVICDEAHSVRNRTASRTKRFLRYLGDNPQVKLFTWSGTLTSRSLKDYAHLSSRSLGEGSPTPLHYPVVEEWAASLDPVDFPRPPGALLKLANHGEKLVDAWRKRLVETPGVVSSGDVQACQASLIIEEYKATAPDKIKQYIEFLEKTAERPDGEQLVDMLQVSKASRELASGFFYRWRWPRKEAPEVIETWLKARKEWHKELRERLKHSSEHMDSPLLLTKAAIRWHDGYVHIERGPRRLIKTVERHDGPEEYYDEGPVLKRHEVPPHTRNGPLKVWDSEKWLAWKAVRDTCEPQTEAVWVSDYLVQKCKAWTLEPEIKGTGAIIWYDFKAFGDALREALPDAVYCGPGEEGNARLLTLTGDELVIASIRAHGTGKNLQMFSKNLVANPPSDGAVFEQLLGRTHRQGQRADEVFCYVFRHTEAMAKAVDRARELSSYISGTFGGTQKLADKATWRF